MDDDGRPPETDSNGEAEAVNDADGDGPATANDGPETTDSDGQPTGNGEPSLFEAGSTTIEPEPISREGALFVLIGVLGTAWVFYRIWLLL